MRLRSRLGKRSEVPVALAAVGGDEHAAATALGRDVRFVRRWSERVRQGKGFGNEHGGGRKRKLTQSSVKYAKQLACRRRKLGCKTIAQRIKKAGLTKHPHESVSESTVRRALKRGSHGLVYKALDRRQRLTETHKHQRVDWATAHRNDDIGDWMYTDSKIFLQQKASNRSRWQRRGSQPVVEVDKHPNKSHVYAGLTKYGVTDLYAVTGTTGLPSRGTKGVGAAEYCDVIEKHLVPEGNRLFRGRPFTVYEDGAPPHRSKLAAATWEKYPHVSVVRGPPCSPDMNPIENLWNIVDDKLTSMVFQSHRAFAQELWRQWRVTGEEQCKPLHSSVPRRLAKVIRAGGGHIERNLYR